MCEDNRTLEYIQDRLNSEERIAFLEHLITCDECRDELKELLELKKFVKLNEIEVPPFKLELPQESVLDSLKKTATITKKSLKLCRDILFLGGQNE
ncbi:hypothetical protein [Guggenheimella bovis]